jgi:NAD(P)-dependent dehydrogenase (short-subunit alcohol dehydrogenase family)
MSLLERRRGDRRRPPRTVLVTGASGGVGRGVAIACGEAGWEVWIAARRADQGEVVAAEVTAAGGSGHFLVCDVTDEDSVRGAIEQIRVNTTALHGVVHNSTSGYSSTAQAPGDVPIAELEDQIAVSLRGTYLLARTAFPLLRDSGGGSYVVMTSEAGFEGKKLLAAYAMVKAAQRGLTRSLAREWGPAGVRVNGVAPLAMTPAMEKAFVSDPAMEKRVMGRNPLQRLGDPIEDVGTAVRFLLSAEARYVTGQTLMVDGGSCPVT